MSDNADKSKYKVIYNRAGCIGADMCTFVDPEHFVMADDNKANLVGGKQDPENKDLWIMETNQPCEDMGNDLRRAADSCPAGVIKIIRLADGTRIAGYPADSEKFRFGEKLGERQK